MLAERERSQEVVNTANGIELIKSTFPWHRLQALKPSQNDALTSKILIWKVFHTA